YCASLSMSFGKVCGVRSMRMFALADGSYRYVWKPLVESVHLGGAPMLKPAVSVPVAGRVNLVQPAGSGPVVCSLIALTICGAVSAGASDGVAGDDEPPSGVPVVPCRSSTMVAAPAPAPSTASSTSASHNPVRRLRAPAG